MRVSRRALTALPYLLAAVGLTVVAVGVATAHDTEVTVSPAARASTDPAAGPVESSVALPRVAPLTARVPAHVLVISAQPLTGAQERALVRATGARAALAVSAGPVTINTGADLGRTTALGVDPGAFRAWTPKGTAESDAVWASVGAGQGAVAHVVGRASEVPLGGTVLAQGTFPARLDVGSFTTTALPGIGLLVNGERAAELGLQPHTGLLLSVPQRPSAESARLARQAVKGLLVSAVEYATVPVRAGGWNIPAVGRISSGFGNRLHPIKHVVLFHDGIDIAAPFGAPVYAMSAGTVLYAGPARGFGTEVVLSHAGGVVTVYGHVSRILVTSGPVAAGQPIALIGNEGDSTGPHLHAEVRIDDRAVDPVAWLRAHGVRL